MARMIMDGSNSSPSNVLSSSYILKSIKYPNSNPFNRPDNASFGRPVHPRDRRLEIAQGSSVIEGQPDLQHAGISDSSRQIMPGFFGIVEVQVHRTFLGNTRPDVSGWVYGKRF
ncbi:hypothetical protein PCANC_03292 [Puccinia coronata f. sp. avenae]|uniref:Uncharacterized protein n=1 Tax=Puccinia coronata f. sp. avenae TaxID=200324 RepID=A0A2N5VYU7_9BASI|nr:hypothetical protein PCANC_03292 [Puccinia coronata f. sp. avenae]